MTTSWDAVRTPEFMKATKDMNTLLGWEATKIDRDKKVVEVRNVKTGEEKALPYDKVVIATGSSNSKPPITNIDAKGVLVLLLSSVLVLSAWKLLKPSQTGALT